MMKRRNLALALVLIALFLAAGRVYFRTYARQKPFAVILFVTEGLTPARLAAARQYAGGSDARLAMEYFPRVGLLRAAGADYAVPDTAAAATALATGRLANLRAVGIDAEGREPVTLTELALSAGRATGLVTDGALAGGGPAAFYARNRDARDLEASAAQLLDGWKFEIALGGGAGDFRGDIKGGRRKDQRDVDLDAQRQDIVLARNPAELEAVAAWRGQRVLAPLADDEVPPATMPLADLTRRAIELLQFRTGGYFLVVHAARGETAARANQSEKTLQALLDLDRAVSVARQYAGSNALIVIAGLHDTGGLSLNGYPLRTDKGVALLGINVTSSLPSFTWSTGPNGLRQSGAPSAGEPAAVFSESAVGTVADVLVLATGEGSDALPPWADAAQIFELIRAQM